MVNNCTHGVELHVREEKTRQNKETKEQETYITTKIFYYPNPVIALRHWISDTDNSTSLEELEKHYEKTNELLTKIYTTFRENKRKI